MKSRYVTNLHQHEGRVFVCQVTFFHLFEYQSHKFRFVLVWRFSPLNSRFLTSFHALTFFKS